MAERAGFGRVSTNITADDLINHSMAHDETAYAVYTPALAADLELECADYSAAEYWGTSDDVAGGESTWRVHLTGRRDIVVGGVVELCTADDERPDPDALNYYVAVTVTVAGVECRVGVCVGARECDHGSVRASGAGVRPYCTAWWVDPIDHASLPAGWRDAVESELLGVSWRLYSQASEMASA